MPAVCLAFSIHQPHRLRRYSIFDASPHYIDDLATAQAVTLAAHDCYLPALRLLLAAATRHPTGPHAFRAAIAISGTAVDLLERHAPEVLQLLHALHATGTVEFLGTTYHASLASLYSRAEFAEQTRLHSQLLKRLFGTSPKVFRNTELLYNNDLAAPLADLSFSALLTEASPSLLNTRSASFLYTSSPTSPSSLNPNHNLNPNLSPALSPQSPIPNSQFLSPPPPTLLLRHPLLSNTLGRNLADPSSPLFPFTLEKFSATLADIGGQLCNLFFDLESFGLWQPPTTGSLHLLANLLHFFPSSNSQLLTPSETLAKLQSAGTLDIPQLTSSSPTHDASPYLGNAMQSSSQQDLYSLEAAVKNSPDRSLLTAFRTLTAADHPLYMSTRPSPQTTSRNPYESPYDAYINFMNILDNLKLRAKP